MKQIDSADQRDVVYREGEMPMVEGKRDLGFFRSADECSRAPLRNQNSSRESPEKPHVWVSYTRSRRSVIELKLTQMALPFVVAAADGELVRRGCGRSDNAHNLLLVVERGHLSIL